MHQWSTERICDSRSLLCASVTSSTSETVAWSRYSEHPTYLQSEYFYAKVPEKLEQYSAPER